MDHQEAFWRLLSRQEAIEYAIGHAYPPIELPSPWEQGGGEKGYIHMLVLGAHSIR